MKICRFNTDRLGVVSGDGATIRDVSEALRSLPAIKWPARYGDHLIRHLDDLRPVIEKLLPDASPMSISDVSLECPVATPSKIIAAPVNYQKHLDEARADKGINFGNPTKTIDQYGLFIKATSSLVGPSHGVRLPDLGRRIDHEIEIAVIIGRSGRNIPREDALSYIAGYAIGLDMTIRGEEDRSWRKSFDSFSVCGPWLVTADEIADPGNLNFSLTIGSQVRQSSNTGLLVFDIPKLIEYASSAYELHPGDIIMTGTPEGVSPVDVGDEMHCTADGIGEMIVRVMAKS